MPVPYLALILSFTTEGEEDDVDVEVEEEGEEEHRAAMGSRGVSDAAVEECCEWLKAHGGVLLEEGTPAVAFDSKVGGQRVELGKVEVPWRDIWRGSKR